MDTFGDFIRILILDLSRAEVAITLETDCNLDDDDHHQQNKSHNQNHHHHVEFHHQKPAVIKQGQFCGFEKISEMRQNLILN